jgi:hypothetical protein
MRTIALTFAVFSFAASTSAAEIYKLNKTVKARKELTVNWFFKNLKDNCESGEPPEIDLNIPPKGGTVCLRPGMVRVRNIWTGRNQHCIGTKVWGVQVIYIPFESFIGVDSTQFTVKMGPPWNRTYEAKINVEGGELTAVDTSSASSEPQKAGPIPTCPALVS